MQKLSAYVLTKNSEKYLARVLAKLNQVADEIIVVDSGSTDKTTQIVVNNSNARLIFRAFDNFVNQRNFAAEQCSYDWVLFVDSDEILNDEAINAILKLKSAEFMQEAYAIRRDWIVLGKSIRCLLPVKSPDFPIRLFNKKIISFTVTSKRVHETPTGYSRLGIISGAISHHTFENQAEIQQKLQQYTDLAAGDLIENKSQVNYFKLGLSPIGAFIKWYFIKGGYRDGKVGFILGKYAYNYAKLKYAKALKISQK